MDKEKIYFVEWRSFGSNAPTREIITAASIEQLFQYYNDLSHLVTFSFEDITDQDLSTYERKILYNGKFV